VDRYTRTVTTAAPTTSYCTIIARNYLAKALTLTESLRRYGAADRLYIMVIDARDVAELPEVPGVVWMVPDQLALSTREVLDLAMMYDLTEFATAIKPLLLLQLLDDTDQAIYLDPDTYLASPMVELVPAVRDSEAGILLTPHVLEPNPSDGTLFSEGHLLYVGMYNLGFCAVDRRATEFLHWWWSHLRTECLHSPMDGLFVDQKWIDIGSVLFHATAWRHYGYNVGIGNLHERVIESDSDGPYVAKNGDRLRLFHFHAFDPTKPDELSAKFVNRSHGDVKLETDTVKALCREYAAGVLENQKLVGALVAQPYGFAADSSGRQISRRMRTAYRQALLAGATDLPSPFVPSEISAYAAWRKASWRSVTKELLSDGAKTARLVLPEEYVRFKKRFPNAARAARTRSLSRSGLWE
jgi:hypothetical protein